MEAGKFSFKFSRQTQKNLVGRSKYAYFNTSCNPFGATLTENQSRLVLQDDAAKTIEKVFLVTHFKTAPFGPAQWDPVEQFVA
jgi:hypothetical protein